MSIVTRRSFIGAAVVVVAGAAGVTAELVRHPRRSPSRTSTRSPSGSTSPPSPELTLLTHALTREQALLTRLDDAVHAAPRLRDQLGVLRADHRAHADVLSALIAATAATPTSSTSAASPASSVPSTSTSPPPSAAATTVAQVMAWEKANAAAVGRDCPAAAGTAAAVLASIFACEQTHVAWLA